MYLSVNAFDSSFAVWETTADLFLWLSFVVCVVAIVAIDDVCTAAWGVLHFFDNGVT